MKTLVPSVAAVIYMFMLLKEQQLMTIFFNPEWRMREQVMWTEECYGKYNKVHALGHASRMHEGNTS